MRAVPFQSKMIKFHMQLSFRDVPGYVQEMLPLTFFFLQDPILPFVRFFFSKKKLVIAVRKAIG